VEFAILVVPLCVLLFGIINWGLMLGDRQAVSQAASEGARAAAVHPGAEPDKLEAARTAIATALAPLGVTGCAGGALQPSGKGECRVVIEGCDRGAGGEGGATACVRAEIVLDYDAVIPGFGIAVPDVLRYEASAQVG